MKVGINNLYATDLAQHLRTSRVLAKSVRQGDIVVDDSSVFYVTRTSRDDENNIVLGEVDGNDMVLAPEVEVTILDRKITKKIR